MRTQTHSAPLIQPAIAWREKLDQPSAPRLVRATDAGSERFRAGSMLVPTPRLIQEVLRSVPAGQFITMSALRQKLAEAHAADYTCPLSTGMFLRIVAEAAEEASNDPLRAVDAVAWWRCVRDDGQLSERFPGGAEEQARRLLLEGVHVAHRGNKYMVIPDKA